MDQPKFRHLRDSGDIVAREDTGSRVYQSVAAEIAAKIHSGEYPDKALLPSERELVDQFGVSRTSIRQALLSLQASGLIALRNRARAQVTHLNGTSLLDQLGHSAQAFLAQRNGVADFQEARLLFECGLARHAARHASPKEIGRLGAALAENKKAIGDREAFTRTDLAFHDILAEIPKNPIFVALNNALADWLAEQRTAAMFEPADVLMQNAFEGHAAVYEAIARHDAEGADHAMLEHLRTVQGFYWDAHS